MKYCAYCGSSITNSANYCPYCGAAAYDGEKKVSSLVYEPEDLDTGYRIVLFSRGTCSQKTAKEVLSDLLGYTTATAADLLDNVPIEIADELTELQAVTIAQALSEYGMDVSIVDEDDTYVDFTDKAVSSVFDSNGTLIASALAALTTLSAANRVHRYRRYRKPSLLEILFRPRYVPRRPVHVRRNIVRYPEPRQRFEVRPRPKPQPVTPFFGSNRPSKPSKPAPSFGNKRPASGNSSPKKPAVTSTRPAFDSKRPASANKTSRKTGMHVQSPVGTGFVNRKPAGKGKK